MPVNDTGAYDHGMCRADQSGGAERRRHALDPRDNPNRADPATIDAVPDPPADGEPVVYKRYIVERRNRS